VRFALEHHVDATPEAVSAAYADPALYESFGALPRAGRPEVIGHRVDARGHVLLSIRWAFTAELSSAARAVIDPDRLTWVQESIHDVEGCAATYRMVPDHYADRFSSSGTYRFSAAPGGGCTRRSEGEVKVRAPLVGRAVEGAIVDGLKEQLAAEVPLVERFIKG
jgi:hypothetical protein